MMSASVVEGGSLTVPFINKKLGKNEEIIDAELRFNIENLLNALFQEINNKVVKLGRIAFNAMNVYFLN